MKQRRWMGRPLCVAAGIAAIVVPMLTAPLHAWAQAAAETKLTAAQKKDILASEEQIFHFVSNDTGLAIHHPVKCVFISREELTKELRKKFDEDKSNQRMERSELVMKKFGLLDQSFQLRPFLLSLLTEQIAGFYDNKTKQMTLLDWVDIDQQKPVMAHELTHALQDQRVDLTKWEDPEPEAMSKDVAEDNEHIRLDEAGTTREAVLEGQAMVTFADYALDTMSQKGQTVLDRPDLVERLVAGAGDHSDSPVLERAPLVLQQALLFPYTYGFQFEYAVLKQGGKVKAFAGVLDNPPTDSAEIFEPAEYLKQTPQPVLRLPDIHPTLKAAGWEPLDVGVMGQLDVRMMAELFGGPQAAAALAPKWAGGIYYAARRTDASAADRDSTRAVGILYLQRFTDADAAASFLQLFENELPRQYVGLQRNAASETDSNERVYSTTTEGDVLLRRDGNEVWVSEGFPLAMARTLHDGVEAANPVGYGPIMQASDTPKIAVPPRGPSADLAGWIGSMGTLKIALR